MQWGPYAKRLGKAVQRQVLFSPFFRPLCWMGAHHRSKRRAYNDGKAMRTVCSRCGTSLIKDTETSSWKEVPSIAAAPKPRKKKAK